MEKINNEINSNNIKRNKHNFLSHEVKPINKNLNLVNNSYEQKNNLYNACKKGLINEVKYSVEQGENINEEGNDGCTPLNIACLNGYEDIVKYLVEQGADINKIDNHGWTPLYIA